MTADRAGKRQVWIEQNVGVENVQEIALQIVAIYFNWSDKVLS